MPEQLTGGRLGVHLIVRQSLAANTGQVRHREWDVIRVGSNPPQTVLDATRFATEEILSACGIPLALNVQAQGSVLREAWRIFLFGTIAPLGRIVQTELSAKIGETGISWDELKASDLAGRARAFQSMVGGGMDVNKAASLSGLMEGE